MELQSVAELHSGIPSDGVLDEEYDDTVPYLSFGNVREGSTSDKDQYLPREMATTIADQSTVLLSVLGKDVVTYIPTESLAPADGWAIVDFTSPDEALVYEAFFNSNLGTQQISTLKTEWGLNRVNVSDIQELLVPRFTDDQITERANAIRERQQEIERLEAERERLEREQEELVDDMTDLLSGGESDE